MVSEILQRSSFMPGYTITVMDTDRRRRKPLATYSVASSRDAFELAAICRALGHRAQDIAVCSSASEAA